MVSSESQPDVRSAVCDRIEAQVGRPVKPNEPHPRRVLRGVWGQIETLEHQVQALMYSVAWLG